MSKPYYLIINEIADLSEKYPFWKIHLLGDLSLNTKTNEMLIDVWLVPLTHPELYEESENHHRLVNNYYYDFSESRRIQIGVGQLPILLHGTIFQNGETVAHPKFVTRKFDVTPTEENQKIISSGDAWGQWKGKKRYYIPSDQFQTFEMSSERRERSSSSPYPAKFLVMSFSEDQTHLAAEDEYPLNQTRWFSERGAVLKEGERMSSEVFMEVQGLIFPCMEMIRFYMTNSSQSCQELLSDGLAGLPYRFFNSKKTVKPDENGNGGFVTLSKTIPDEDRQIVSRPAFDPYALGEYRRPYFSAFNNKLKEGLFLPEARFPFRDQKTKLTVHGTYLQSGNRVYFLVFWIDHCTAAFPYVNAEFFRDNPGSKKSPATEAEIYQDKTVFDEDDEHILGEKFDYEAEERKNVTARHPGGGKLQSDDAASRARSKFKLSLEQADRFEYQKTHPLKEAQPKTANETSGTLRPVKPDFVTHSEEEEIIGTAPAGGSNPVTPVLVVPKADEVIDCSPGDTPATRELSPPDLPVETENDDKEKAAPQSKSKALPINLDLFKTIIKELNKSDAGLQVRMISIPKNGDYEPTESATSFPSVYTSQIESKERDSYLPTELFVAEIKSKTGQFAYLMDIEAGTTRKGGVSSRTFKMFLCFVFPTHKKLAGEMLRKILSRCEDNGGKWVMEVVPPTNEKIYLSGHSFKHSSDSAEKYAARILYTLQESLWLKVSDGKEKINEIY